MRCRSRIWSALLLSVALPAGHCAMTGPATETEAALCDAWRDSLPTRSHADTERTQQEIGRNRAAWRAICEAR